MKSKSGITSVIEWRFSAAICLYLLSVLFFAETGNQEPFIMTQIVFSAMIAFVISTSLCWQWQILGSPRNLANSILHIAFFVSCVFCISRLFVKTETSVADMITNLTEWHIRKIISWIPAVIFDALRSPGIAILFAATVLSLSFRRRTAMALLILSLFITVLLCFRSSPDKQAWIWFFGAMAAIVTALYLQYDDPVQRQFQAKVTARLKGDRILKADLELRLRILERLHECRRPMTPTECLGVISRALGTEMESPHTREITRRITHHLVFQDQLAEYVPHESGKALALSTEAFDPQETDGFVMAAVVPKSLMFAVFAMLWILSPIDLIPDAIPIFGSVDDVFVGTLGFNTLLQTLGGIHIAKAGRDRG
jgi:hypothetical protein